MRRVAWLLVIMLIVSFLFVGSAKAAQGWISDIGNLTLKIGDDQIVGFPVQIGYGYTFTLYARDGSVYKTNFVPLNMAGQKKLFGSSGLMVNREWVLATRLGNGWLFEFKEVRVTSTKN